MRQLTFKGFLHQYVQAMSNAKTNDLRRLADEVSRNHRLVEPLVLYASAVNKRGYLQRLAKDSYLVKAASYFPDDMSWDDIVLALEKGDKSIPPGFLKAYRSYVSVRDRQKSMNHTKSLMLAKTRRLQKEKNVTTYRIYTDLGLNHGNVNAYVKNCDVSRVSLEVAERMLEYLERK